MFGRAPKLHLVLAVVLLPLFAHCKEQPAEKRVASFPTPAEFTQEVAEAYRKKDPAVKVEVAGELELKVTAASGESLTNFLNNTYDAYRQDPESKEEAVGKLIDLALQALAKGDEPLDRSRIVPVVKDRGWLAEMKKMARENAGKGPVEHLHEDFNEELVIVYAEDRDSGVAYPSAAVFQELGIERKDMRALACENLKKLLPELQRVGADGYYILTADGNYEASLLLLEGLWTPEKLEVKGEIVVAIPARDTLFVTGSEEKEGLAKVKAAAAKVAAESAYRLTPTLFVFRAGKFVRFE
jgi:uncharacterized protein YtpQ (UPF0354 family)